VKIPSTAEITADLTSAAAYGERALFETIRQKLAAMELDADDRLAIADAIATEAEGYAKVAALSDSTTRAVILGSLLAPPAIMGVNAIMKSRAKEQNWNNAVMHDPTLADDPRGRAYFDLLHDAAPNIAGNGIIATDLLKQMRAQPIIDLGTVRSVSDVHKAWGGDGVGGAVSGIFGSLGLGDTSSIQKDLNTVNILANPGSGWSTKKEGSLRLRATHISEDNVPCVFDWSTEACKQAGLTDLFMAPSNVSGDPYQQANTAFNLGAQTEQYPLLPLDSIVRELLMKEQELAQREEAIAMREQQMAAAQQEFGGLQGAYDQTMQEAGQVPGEAPEAVEPMPEAPAEGEVPPAPEGDVPPAPEGDVPQAPAETPAETPAQVPAEVPAQAPAGIPAEDDKAAPPTAKAAAPAEADPAMPMAPAMGAAPVPAPGMAGAIAPADDGLTIPLPPLRISFKFAEHDDLKARTAQLIARHFK
jgi:hypothetical protein